MLVIWDGWVYPIYAVASHNTQRNDISNYQFDTVHNSKMIFPQSTLSLIDCSWRVVIFYGHGVICLIWRVEKLHNDTLRCVCMCVTVCVRDLTVVWAYRYREQKAYSFGHPAERDMILKCAAPYTFVWACECTYAYINPLQVRGWSVWPFCSVT